MSTTHSERRTVFISHALPEDNEFALWLSIKLRNEGYDVWCELEQVHGGEHFWKEIQLLLQSSVAKFVFVASHASVRKEGVRDEWDYARSIAKEHQLKDFIIPLNLDGVSHNAIIGLPNLAMIQFQNSWAQGLRALLAKLRKDDVPRNEHTPLSAAHWYQNKFATSNNVLEKQEILYSNWVGLPTLPSTLYLHEYANDAQAKQVMSVITAANSFPADRHDRYIIAFEPRLPDLHQRETAAELFAPTIVKATNVIQLSVAQICGRRYKSEVFPTKQDASNFLVRVLHQAVHNFLVQRGLHTYEMANKRLCYFRTRHESTDPKFKYYYGSKLRSKQLTGVYLHDNVWHYGVSFNVRLHPHPSLSLKAHIVFSKDGATPWDDKKAMQTARRKKGKRMFNAEWRDLQLAFLGSLTDDATTFGIPITQTDYLWLSTTPICFVSDKGYNDPEDQGRLIPLDDYDDAQEQEADVHLEFDDAAALSELLADDNSSLPSKAHHREE
ncbi:toll/interleukin-1 receptor domain-containing protein [Hymenobacter sp. HSC-4F20]|uniref:toll/interleukin-1 receptor domain-containing protein n=1 Tax=Hymenobacter sp. HSC-4F20 TaxID=2864135 RepID=UPI001C73A87D|nr:toll/interleukin-1 receptor domain-containing protein [Hymenobacter sp. HSC-4F20]MBX0291012.1 toll/interleukin-1 receptor domain-containing protein [Hymenobacter sp. HSC-4F20]